MQTTVQVEVKEGLKQKFLYFVRDIPLLALDGCTIEAAIEYVEKRMQVCYLTSEEIAIIEAIYEYAKS
jgi:hypothetical protein